MIVRHLLATVIMVFCLLWALPLGAQQDIDPITDEETVDGVTRATTPSGDGEDSDSGGCDCGTQGEGRGNPELLLLAGLGLWLKRRPD